MTRTSNRREFISGLANASAFVTTAQAGILDKGNEASGTTDPADDGRIEKEAFGDRTDKAEKTTREAKAYEEVSREEWAIESARRVCAAPPNAGRSAGRVVGGGTRLEEKGGYGANNGLESAPRLGAYFNKTIGYGIGLLNPELRETVQVRSVLGVTAKVFGTGAGVLSAVEKYGEGDIEQANAEIMMVGVAWMKMGTIGGTAGLLATGPIGVMLMLPEVKEHFTNVFMAFQYARERSSNPYTYDLEEKVY